MVDSSLWKNVLVANHFEIYGTLKKTVDGKQIIQNIPTVVGAPAVNIVVNQDFKKVCRLSPSLLIPYSMNSKVVVILMELCMN
jgi:hypothetical protein